MADVCPTEPIGLNTIVMTMRNIDATGIQTEFEPEEEPASAARRVVVGTQSTKKQIAAKNNCPIGKTEDARTSRSNEDAILEQAIVSLIAKLPAKRLLPSVILPRV